MLGQLSQEAANATSLSANELTSEAEKLLDNMGEDAKEGLKELQTMNLTLGRPGALALLHAIYGTLNSGEERFTQIKHIPDTVEGGGMEICVRGGKYFMRLGEVSPEHDLEAEFAKVRGGLSPPQRKKIEDNFSAMIFFARKCYSTMLELNREELADLDKKLNPLALNYHEENATFSVQQNGVDLEPRMGCIISC
ncbi:MAG: hypothetical protein P1U53_13010 [Sulfitobacter sp.]|nr:hypothetical protein [Sulfitobacter sp.]